MHEPSPDRQGAFEPIPDASLTVADIVQPLWRARVALALVAALCAALPLAFQLARRPVFVATAVVRVVESRTELFAAPTSAENSRPLLENKEIAAGLIDEFSIRSVATFRWEQPTQPIPVDHFVHDVIAVSPVAGTNLLRVAVTLPDAGQAAAVANALVQRATALNQRINQEGVVAARDYIKGQLDEASARLERARNELVTVKQESQVDALQQTADEALKTRGRLNELRAAIENERAFLTRSEADLAQSRQLLTTRRSIDDDATLTEAARERLDGSTVQGLSVTSEQVNAAYEQLERQVTESRARLAGFEGEHRLHSERSRREAAVPAFGKLYAGEISVSRLEAEYETALDIYTDLSMRYTEAQITVFGRGAQLQLVDPAVPPSSPTSARRVSAALLGALVGVLLGASWVLVRRFFPLPT